MGISVLSAIKILMPEMKFTLINSSGMALERR